MARENAGFREVAIRARAAPCSAPEPRRLVREPRRVALEVCGALGRARDAQRRFRGGLHERADGERRRVGHRGAGFLRGPDGLLRVGALGAVTGRSPRTAFAATARGPPTRTHVPDDAVAVKHGRLGDPMMNDEMPSLLT